MASWLLPQLCVQIIEIRTLQRSHARKTMRWPSAFVPATRMVGRPLAQKRSRTMPLTRGCLSLSLSLSLSFVLHFSGGERRAHVPVWAAVAVRRGGWHEVLFVPLCPLTSLFYIRNTNNIGLWTKMRLFPPLLLCNLSPGQSDYIHLLCLARNFFPFSQNTFHSISLQWSSFVTFFSFLSQIYFKSCVCCVNVTYPQKMRSGYAKLSASPHTCVLFSCHYIRIAFVGAFAMDVNGFIFFYSSPPPMWQSPFFPIGLGGSLAMLPADVTSQIKAPISLLFPYTLGCWLSEVALHRKSL